MGIDPVTHSPRSDLNLLSDLPQLLAAANFNNLMNNVTWDNGLRQIQLLHNIILQTLSSNPLPNMEAAATNLIGSNAIYEVAGYNSVSPLDIEAPQPPLNDQYHPLKDSKPGFNDNGEMGSSSYVVPISNRLLPPFVSFSPDDHHCNQTETCCRINPYDISNPSSTSTTFEALGDIMDDEASCAYCREIIE